MKARMIPVFILIVLLPGFLPAADMTAANQVRLKSDAVVEQELVLLKDIAEIRGPSRDRLGEIMVVKAPAGKTGITLSADFVAGKIRFLAKDAFLLQGTSVKVSRKYVKVSSEELRQIYIREVMHGSPWKDRGEIVIEDVSAPGNVEVLSSDRGRLQAKFSPTEDFLGPVSLRIAFGSGAKVTVSGRVAVLTDIPISLGIGRGSVVDASMLTIKRMDVSRLGDVFANPQECIGMRAKTAVEAGRPILRTSLEACPVVASGDTVIIVAKRGALSVSDRGVALRDGQLSQKIPVKNLSSGRQVVGTVIAPSRVQVLF